MRKTEVTCGKCGAIFDVHLWESVHTLSQPDLKPKVMNGSFFMHACPHCHFSMRVLHRFFYHDPEKRLMLLMDPKEDRAEVFFVDKVHLYNEGYALRLASTLNGFQETIHLFEMGLNDKAMELFKSAQIPKVLRSYPGRSVDTLRFLPQDTKKYFHFQVLAGDRIIANNIVLQREQYDDICRALSSYMNVKGKPGRFVRVDASWMQSNEGRYLIKKLTKLMPLAGDTILNPRHVFDTREAQDDGCFCTQCGAWVLAEANYCTQCGKAVFPDPETIRSGVVKKLANFYEQDMLSDVEFTLLITALQSPGGKSSNDPPKL